MFCQKIYNRKFISDIKKFSEKTLYLSILFIKPKTFYIKKSKMLLHFKKPSGDCKLYIILFCLPTTTNDDAPTAQRRRRMSHLKKNPILWRSCNVFLMILRRFFTICKVFRRFCGNFRQFCGSFRQFCSDFRRFCGSFRRFCSDFRRFCGGFTTILRRFYIYNDY